MWKITLANNDPIISWSYCKWRKIDYTYSVPPYYCINSADIE